MYLIKTSERFLQFDRILFPDNYGMQMKSKKREESEKKPWITPACKEMFPSDEDEDQNGDLDDEDDDSDDDARSGDENGDLGNERETTILYREVKTVKY